MAGPKSAILSTKEELSIERLQSEAHNAPPLPMTNPLAKTIFLKETFAPSIRNILVE